MSEQKKSKKTAKPTNAPQGTKAQPKFKAASVEFTVQGRIHGTGHRLTDQEKAEMLRLRAKDPETYTLRRLAAVYGLDPGSVFYALNGGRNKAKAKAEARSKRAKASKVKVIKAKAAKSTKPALQKAA